MTYIYIYKFSQLPQEIEFSTAPTIPTQSIEEQKTLNRRTIDELKTLDQENNQVSIIIFYLFLFL